jgi:hypothetical protein
LCRLAAQRLRQAALPAVPAVLPAELLLELVPELLDEPLLDDVDDFSPEEPSLDDEAAAAGLPASPPVVAARLSVR